MNQAGVPNVAEELKSDLFDIQCISEELGPSDSGISSNRADLKDSMFAALTEGYEFLPLDCLEGSMVFADNDAELCPSFTLRPKSKGFFEACALLDATAQSQYRDLRSQVLYSEKAVLLGYSQRLVGHTLKQVDSWLGLLECYGQIYQSERKELHLKLVVGTRVASAWPNAQMQAAFAQLVARSLSDYLKVTLLPQLQAIAQESTGFELTLGIVGLDESGISELLGQLDDDLLDPFTSFDCLRRSAALSFAEEIMCTLTEEESLLSRNLKSTVSTGNLKKILDSSPLGALASMADTLKRAIQGIGLIKCGADDRSRWIDVALHSLQAEIQRRTLSVQK